MITYSKGEALKSSEVRQFSIMKRFTESEYLSPNDLIHTSELYRCASDREPPATCEDNEGMAASARSNVYSGVDCAD